MPKFRYAGPGPRIYSEVPYPLGQVEVGEERELDSPPDHFWEPVGAKAKAAAKDTPVPPKTPTPRKSARAKKPQTDQPVQAPAEPGEGIPGDQPLDQPAPDPSDA